MHIHTHGLSPRMWGTVGYIGHITVHQRFIPTHVGNRNRKNVCWVLDAVYPHACGEQIHYATSTVNILGLSPRMWGTVQAASSCSQRLRFIPTHVGNSYSGCRDGVCMAVHPHACGEQCDNRPSPQIVTGSSPRMWGTAKPMTRREYNNRFIPTHVGNRYGEIRLSAHAPVHPHACGEQFKRFIFAYSVCGSSPRMWGTDSHAKCHRCSMRFIPTHVGNRVDTVKRTHRLAVYPHACGEQLYGMVQDTTIAGLSPRMWGTGIW